ncbi:MAG TPA: NAD(P)-dependent oxidoreductase [Alphaproteobacteria bacterium]|jgi:3-hydroxyisobutyrate dehydrogenase|nr:NAD(P)-dependent oxidoreductase [Alphaproteobacteria bacterium]
MADQAKKPTVGYIGIGLMGKPMTLRLLAAGYRTRVWNRSRAKLKDVLEKGAIEARTPAELTQASEIVFMCVTDTAAAEEVVFGPEGVARGAEPGKTLVDFSSIRPDSTRIMAGRLKEATGMAWVDAPVSGGVQGAAAGSLAIMAGGEAEDVERVRPVVMTMCQRFTHMGPSGAGQITKLCNQVIVGSTLAVLAEAVNLAERAGVDAKRLPEALTGGWADSKPFQIFVPRMAGRAFEPKIGAVTTMLKDLDTATSVGHANRAALPMTALAAELMRTMLAHGTDEDDMGRLVTLHTGK